MNKPFTLQVQETEEKIVKTINESNIPAYVLKQIVKGIYEQLETIEQQEIQEYMNKGNKELENSSFSNKKKKGNDK